MNLVGLLLDASRRISGFVRREVLGVFLPGLMTLLGGAWIATVSPLLGSSTTPARLLSAWVERIFPQNALARVILVLVVAYFAFGVGQLTRMLVFWWVFRGKDSDEAYLAEVGNAWSSLAAAFGVAAVEGVFKRHGLAHGLKDRFGRDGPISTTPGASEEVGGATVPAAGASSRRFVRSVGDTRIEFTYCKAWLSTRGSKLATDHFEDTINLLCAIPVPFATITLLVAQFLVLAVFPGQTLMRGLVVAGAVVVFLVFSAALMKEVRKQQRHENFDTLKHFFFQNWMDAHEGSPAPGATTVATSAGDARGGFNP